MEQDERARFIRTWAELTRDLGVASLTPDQFKRIDGKWTLDGMDPAEWIRAMLMD